MSVKALISLTTLPSDNEQSGTTPRTLTGAATTLSREYREFGSFNRAKFWLDVSAASGTSPTLDVTIQEQDPLSLKWVTLVTFPQQTAATGGTPITPIAAEIYGQNLRAQFVVGGTATPTFTFTLAAVAGCEEALT
jgi:hypothetical protein